MSSENVVVDLIVKRWKYIIGLHLPFDNDRVKVKVNIILFIYQKTQTEILATQKSGQKLKRSEYFLKPL